MKISKEDAGELTSIVMVELVPEDYMPQVSKTLKEQQHKASMPGFRPGHVPMSVIKKMSGKSIIAEQVNKLMIDNLYKYIDENKLNILASPLVNHEKTKITDFTEDTVFNFYYDVAFSPVINVEINDKIKVKQYDIEVNDGVVEKYILDIRRRYGKFSSPEVAGDNDIVFGEFEELDDTENPLENGIKNFSTLSLEYIKNDAAKQLLIGVKKDDILTVDMKAITNSTAEIASMLKIDVERAEKISDKFRLTVKNISTIEPAELNEELFSKVYKHKNITSEEQLREILLKDAQESFSKESERKFMNDIVENLLTNNPLTLPDEFLKRYLIETNEKINPDELEVQYPMYARSLKWQLMENQLIHHYNLKASEHDMHEYAEDYVRKQLSQYTDEVLDEERIHQQAHHLLENKKEMEKLSDQYYDEKLLNLFRTSVKIEHVDISYEEFVKLSSESNK